GRSDRAHRLRRGGGAWRLRIAVRGAARAPDCRERAKARRHREEMTRMEISNVIEKLGRAIFETPFGGSRISKDAPELAEIRLAVLDAVKSKSHRAGGKSVFPYNLVRIHLRGVPDEQAAVFQGEFLAKYLSEELRGGLARAGYRFPDELTVEIGSTPKLPERGEEWLWVETAAQEKAEPAGGPARKTA